MMTRRGIHLSALVLALVSSGVFAFRAVTSAEEEKKPQPDQPKNSKAFPSPDLLGGKERYLAYVNTDKPIYRAEETVYVRGVVLEAHDRTPLTDKNNLTAQVTVKGPKKDILAQVMTQLRHSTVGFSWKIPSGQTGGEYTAEVSFPWSGQPTVTRKFEIRAYRPPRLKTQIEFVRDGYGPGDTVSASVKVERAEGGIPTGAKVTVRARVDGRQVFQGPAVVDSLGLCSARFELPQAIARGEGTLAFAIEDGGVVETATKTIPILLQTVDLTMYPEGGDLIAGLPNRVYLSALTPAKKPADIAGEIVDSEGTVVSTFRTEHEGRGRFQLKPQADETYTLKITEPSGIKTTFPLPKIRPAGAVLSSLENTTGSKDAVEFSVAGTKTGDVEITLHQKEKELDSQMLSLKEGESQTVKLDAKSASGVLIATLWDAKGKPLAERLVFRKPAQGLNVTITPDRDKYVPGGQASLKIKTTTQDGKPVSSIVGLTVTDDSVLEMIEKREQAPRLPVMVFLESEVKDLADAHVYLDSDNPEAPLAVDLLLGTQGWRRFAFMEREKFLAEHGNNARNVLALTLPSEVERRFLSFARGGAIPKAMAAQARIEEALPQAAPVPDAQEAEGAPGDDKAEEDAAKDPAEKPGANQPAKNPARPAQPPAAESKPAEAKDAKQRAPRQVNELQKALDEGLAKREKKDAFFDREARVGNLRRRAFAPMVVIREFAHQVRADRQPGQRTDFAETLYWNAGIKTDEKTGEATVRFGLSDAVTSFRVMADAFDQSGSITESTTKIESVEPFYTEPKLPLEVTTHDVIQLPISLVNSTNTPLSEGKISIEAEGLTGVKLPAFTLAADGRERVLVPWTVGPNMGTTNVTLSASAGPYADQVTRPLKIVPLGFPVEIAHGGTLDPDGRQQHTVTIPETIVKGSLTADIAVYPTPMASLTGSLERLIREPHGCFEQTSSSTYPLVMAQQYFQSHAGIDPDLIRRSNEMLEKGYKRLTGYECKSGGYEWFGADPGHEALTAYGLMEFTDMAEVFPVDTEMLARTRAWLLKQRDGNGGFTRKRRALHTWVVDTDISNAYITWALLSAGEKDLDDEVATVLKAAENTENTYVLALAANVMVLAGDKRAANRLMDRMIQLQGVDGKLSGATGSIVGSGGQALEIEATALATLAWTSDIDYIDFADKGVRYLSEVCKGGRFGNTQSTVLALKAIVAYDKLQARPKAEGELQLVVDGQPVGEPQKFDTQTQGAIQLPNIADLLKPGKHDIAVAMTGGSRMPYTLAINLHSEKPASSEECQMKVAVSLANQTVKEGAVTEANVVCENTSDKAVPTPVAIIGIPGGLEVRHDQLKELVKSEKIAAYEVLGREVVLYWREMKANEKVELPLSLVAAIPGEYTGPASRAYLYYTDEYKNWANPLKIEVQPIQ